MATKSEKLYGDSPALERDEESGKVSVKKPARADVGEDGSSAEMGGDVPPANERRETAHRHVGERLAIHHRHEMEHGGHKGDKKALHDRHEAELAEMGARHAKEVKAMHGRHEKGAAEPKK
jgi:hypothetical protein